MLRSVAIQWLFHLRNVTLVDDIFCRKSSLIEAQDILEPEQLAWIIFVALHTLEVALLLVCVVANRHHLLFVDLPPVDAFLQRSCADETIHFADREESG